MHFKGFCLLRFDIQNITIKQSAGGCLFDVALTALKTLISQPSPTPPPPLPLWVGGVLGRGRGSRERGVLGAGGCQAQHPPPCQEPHSLLQGRMETNWGEKGLEGVFGWGCGVSAPCRPRVWVYPGVLPLPAGHGDPRGMALALSLPARSTKPPSTAGTQQEHPSGELLLALHALSPMSPPPEPLLFPSCMGASG